MSIEDEIYSSVTGGETIEVLASRTGMPTHEVHRLYKAGQVKARGEALASLDTEVYVMVSHDKQDVLLCAMLTDETKSVRDLFEDFAADALTDTPLGARQELLLAAKILSGIAASMIQKSLDIED